MAATGTGGLLLALLLAFHTLAIRDEQLGRDDSADALAAGEAAAAGADAAVAASALGRLGHRAGDVVFGKFRLVEYRGFAPIGEGVPALYPGHWRPRGRPLSEGEQGEEAASWANALLEGGQGGQLSHNPFPEKIKNFRPDMTGGKKGYLGKGSFGEVWQVTDVYGVYVPSGQTIVLKLFVDPYDGKDTIITDERLKKITRLLEDVDALSKECETAKNIQKAADGIMDTEVKAYADKFMKCHLYSGPGMEKYSKSAPTVEYRTGKQEDTYIYLLLEDCGSESLEDKLYKEVDVGEGEYQRQRRTDWLTPQRAAWVTRELGKGLRYMEEAGYLHRDLKPGNLIVNSSGSGESGEFLKIIDFGYAVKNDAQADPGGTHDFMPNEYYDNYGNLYYAPKEPFTAFDMFSTHVLILEMLTWKTWLDFKPKNMRRGAFDKQRSREWMARGMLAFSTRGLPVLNELLTQPLFLNADKCPLKDRLKEDTKDNAKDFLELWLEMGHLDPAARPTPSVLLNNTWVKGES